MQTIDKLKAMCQLGVNKSAVFSALADSRPAQRKDIARMFGVWGDVETDQFCDDLANLCYGMPFASAVTHERIDCEARELVLNILSRKKLPDGWRRCDSDGSDWIRGDYYRHDEDGLVFRNFCGLELPDDEGLFREVKALDVLKLINSTTRKAVMA